MQFWCLSIGRLGYNAVQGNSNPKPQVENQSQESSNNKIAPKKTFTKKTIWLQLTSFFAFLPFCLFFAADWERLRGSAVLASDFCGRAEPQKLIENLNGCVKKEFLAEKIQQQKMKCSFSRGDTWAAIKKYFNRLGIQIIVFRDRENMTRAQEAPLGILRFLIRIARKPQKNEMCLRFLIRMTRKPQKNRMYLRDYTIIQIWTVVCRYLYRSFLLHKTGCNCTSNCWLKHKNRLLQNKWPRNPLLFF